MPEMDHRSEASTLLTAAQLATRWQVQRSMVYLLTRDGRLPCVRLGRHVRYSLSDVESFERAGGAS